MKIKQLREYGQCEECRINLQRTRGIRIFEIELGTSHIRTVQLCEKCLKELQALQQEE